MTFDVLRRLGCRADARRTASADYSCSQYERRSSLGVVTSQRKHSYVIERDDVIKRDDVVERRYDVIRPTTDVQVGRTVVQ